MKERQREQLVSEFIDDLNQEKKPRVYQQGKVDPELEELFETIRAVKRAGRYRGRRKGFLSSRIFKVAAVAAALFLCMTLISVSDFIGGSERNIVHAVVKAYEELQGYSGIIEIRGENNGEVEYLESIEIQYKKPNKYVAIHRFDGVEARNISDGDTLYMVGPNGITVENLFIERELWRYHIGTPIWQLSEAEDVKDEGVEEILGRKARVLAYRFAPEEGYNRIWIDTENHMPLRHEINTLEGRKLVNEFKEIRINPEIDDSVFDYTPPPGMDLTVENKEISVEKVRWAGIDDLLKAVPSNLELVKVGEMVASWHYFDYALRFQGEGEHDYLDIYISSEPREFFYSLDSELGKLAGGYIELNDKAWNVMELYLGKSSVAKWVNKDSEVFLVSSRPASTLCSILEGYAGEKVEFITPSDLEKEGIELPVEKEGH